MHAQVKCSREMSERSQDFVRELNQGIRELEVKHLNHSDTRCILSCIGVVVVFLVVSVSVGWVDWFVQNY